jgi:triphosphatase
MESWLRLGAAEPAEEFRLAPDLAVGDGLQEMLAGALAAIRGQQNAARLSGPEAIHRFRIGLRRLRSVLSAFADVLPEEERRLLSDRLRAAAQRYGRVRDWDVFIAHTLGQLRAARLDAPVLDLLAERAAAARRQALPPGDALKQSLADVEGAVARAVWLRRPAPGFAPSWTRPLAQHAHALLEQRHEKLRKEVKRADLADQAAFHDLRIRVKKLRYPAELLKSLFDERSANSYLRPLVALQDVLGDLNDVFTGRALALALGLPFEMQSLVLAALTNEAERIRAGFPAAAHAFRHAKLFSSANLSAPQ